MKKIKNVMLLAIGSITVMTVALTSCSSNNPAPGPAAPTVTVISPVADTVGQTITITGTGFTSASTVTIGGTASLVVTFGTATSLTAKVPVGAVTGHVTVTTGSLTSAAGAANAITINAAPLYHTPDGDSLSSQVGTAFLVAYWPFNGNSEESFSTEVGSNLAVGGSPTYSAGVRGQAINFAGGGLIYPPIPALDSINQLQHYTVSLWVKTSGNTNDNRETSLFQINGDFYNDIWGLLAVELKTGNVGGTSVGYGGDTLAIGSEINQIDGRGPVTDDALAVLYPRTTPSQYVSGSNLWTLITVTYNDVTDTSKIYANGVLKLSVLSPVLDPAHVPAPQPNETFTLNPSFGVATPYAHNQVTFGTFMFADEFPLSTTPGTYTDGAPYGPPSTAANKANWHHGFTGSLDDVRVYNNDLSAGEVMDLYLLGLHDQ